MSLSPLVSFKSQFVTYLLNFPRILQILECGREWFVLVCWCANGNEHDS